MAKICFGELPWVFKKITKGKKVSGEYRLKNTEKHSLYQGIDM